MKELVSRTDDLTNYLKEFQHPQVAKVAGAIKVGFFAVATIIMAWPDSQPALRYLTGFGTLGELEATQVLRASETKEGLAIKAMLQNAEAVIEEMRKRKAEDRDVGVPDAGMC